MRILIVTGERNSGKTFFCQNLFYALQELGVECAGCLEISSRDSRGVPYSISLIDLLSSVEYPAAYRSPETQEPFHFFSEAFAHIQESVLTYKRQEFQHSFAQTMNRRKIYIIDEIGPLELFQSDGHTALCDKILADGSADCVVLTVRPRLVLNLKAFISRYISAEDLEIVDINRLSQERALSVGIDALVKP
jgi:nucleoside-triphosphatase THEP1